MKGQYLTIEHVFFFAIGITMVVLVYFTFTNVNSSLREKSAQAQLFRVGESIRGSSLKVFSAANQTNSLVRYNLDIPTSVSGCVYKINVGNFLELTCIDNPKLSASLSMYGINTRTAVLYSTKGSLEISSAGGFVELR